VNEFRRVTIVDRESAQDGAVASNYRGDSILLTTAVPGRAERYASISRTSQVFGA